MSVLGAIDESARTGKSVTLEGTGDIATARQLLLDELAELSTGDCGSAVLTGHDPDDRPYTVRLVDVYAYELEGSHMGDVKFRRSVADARATDGSQPWDLEQWECSLPAYDSPRPDAVPSDATRDYGFMRDGLQWVVFRRVVRRA